MSLIEKITSKIVDYTSQIKALTTYANETTGAGDIRIGDAVQSLIDGYGGGGSIPSVDDSKDIVFYDYNGTPLYSYSLEEAQALTSLPDPPEHDGLVFDCWNWTIEDIRDSNTKTAEIGANYHTSSGYTEYIIDCWCAKGSVTVANREGKMTVHMDDGESITLNTSNVYTLSEGRHILYVENPSSDYVKLSNYVGCRLIEIRLADSQKETSYTSVHGLAGANGVICMSIPASAASSSSGLTLKNQSSTFFIKCLVYPRSANNSCYFSSAVLLYCFPHTLNTPFSFNSLSSCTRMSIPEGVTEIGSFGGGAKMTLLTFPTTVTALGNGNKFNNMYIPLVFPKVKTLASWVFQGCASPYVEFGEDFESIAENSVWCGNLVLRTKGVVTLASTVSVTYNIYVDDDYVDAYKADEKWSAYADKILPISTLE